MAVIRFVVHRPSEYVFYFSIRYFVVLFCSYLGFQIECMILHVSIFMSSFSFYIFQIHALHIKIGLNSGLLIARQPSLSLVLVLLLYFPRHTRARAPCLDKQHRLNVCDNRLCLKQNNTDIKLRCRGSLCLKLVEISLVTVRTGKAMIPS